MMAILKRLWPLNASSCCFSVIAFSAILWLAMVQPSAAQPGFINIDCGGSESFTSVTNLTWVTDETYISTGQIGRLPNPENLSTAYETVRYFPEQVPKNCYELSPVQIGEGYIVTAGFYYGNYDNRGKMPIFSLIIDGTVMVDPVDDDSEYGMYVPAKTSFLSVCLARGLTSSVTASIAGNPFITYLQLRSIPSGTSYSIVAFQQGFGLFGLYAIDLGSNSSSFLSYPNDTLDRPWMPFATEENKTLNTEHNIVLRAQEEVDYAPPIMLQTAAVGTLQPYPLERVSSDSKYHVAMYFAEISPNVTAPGQRVFDIYSNAYQQGIEPWFSSIDIFNLSGGQFMGIEIYSENPVIPPVNDSIQISFKASSTSLHEPIISGIQVLLYTTEPLSNLTYGADLSAIQNIRDFYGINGSSGDPCMPINYPWTWIKCNLSQDIPRVTSILLSKSALKGVIYEPLNELLALTEVYLDGNQLTNTIPEFSSLFELQTLDLHNNKLSGPIPPSLATLPRLKELFLQNNDLEGEVPPTLLAMLDSGTLNFLFGGNPKLTCNGQSCESSPSTKASPPPPSNLAASKNISILLCLSIFLLMLLFLSL